MNLYSIISFKTSFFDAMNSLQLKNKEKKTLRSSFLEFMKIPQIIEMNIFKDIYMSYNSNFYICENNASKFSIAIQEKFGIDIKHFPVPECPDVIHFTNFSNFQELIEKARAFMANPEAKNKKDLEKEKAKELIFQENKMRIELISAIRKPMPKSIKNSRVLSIDFEYDQNNDCRISECGLSSYFNGSFLHEHYIIEGNYENKRNYSLQFKFKFGESKIIKMEELMRILLEKFNNTDYVVGHCLLSEHLIMSYHGLDMLSFKNLTPVDTQYIFKTKFYYDLEHKLVSLWTLLDQLSIPNEHLHNAGNDAAYTLEAFVKMVKCFSTHVGKSKIKVSSISI